MKYLLLFFLLIFFRPDDIFGQTTWQMTSGGANIYYNLGNVGIGTETPDEKLSVNGTIHTKEVKVDVAGWPDYVFHQNYDLLPIEELQLYILQNQHLPEIPSASEIEQNGAYLGEMNKLLLKKIEELTLYILMQHELNIKRQEMIEHLQKESQRRQIEIDKLKK